MKKVNEKKPPIADDLIRMAACNHLFASISGLAETEFYEQIAQHFDAVCQLVKAQAEKNAEKIETAERAVKEAKVIFKQLYNEAKGKDKVTMQSALQKFTESEEIARSNGQDVTRIRSRVKAR